MKGFAGYLRSFSQRGVHSSIPARTSLVEQEKRDLRPSIAILNVLQTYENRTRFSHGRRFLTRATCKKVWHKSYTSGHCLPRALDAGQRMPGSACWISMPGRARWMPGHARLMPGWSGSTCSDTSARIGPPSLRIMRDIATRRLMAAQLLLRRSALPVRLRQQFLWNPSSACSGTGQEKHYNIVDNIVWHWKHCVSRRRHLSCKNIPKLTKLQHWKQYEFICPHCKQFCQ